MKYYFLFLICLFTTGLTAQVSSSNSSTTSLDTSEINQRIIALEAANAALIAAIENDIMIFASGKQANTSTLQSRNATINRTNLGRYSVAFDSPHPDGANYEVVFGAEEDANRDMPKIAVVTGTQTANGFNLHITVDDNGGTADIYRDDTFSFSVIYQR